MSQSETIVKVNLREKSEQEVSFLAAIAAVDGIILLILLKLIYLWRVQAAKNGKWYAFPSIDWLAKELNQPSRTIQRRLADLGKSDILKITRRRPVNGKPQSNLLEPGPAFALHAQRLSNLLEPFKAVTKKEEPGTKMVPHSSESREKNNSSYYSKVPNLSLEKPIHAFQKEEIKTAAAGAKIGSQNDKNQRERENKQKQQGREQAAFNILTSKEKGPWEKEALTFLKSDIDEDVRTFYLTADPRTPTYLRCVQTKAASLYWQYLQQQLSNKAAA